MANNTLSSGIQFSIEGSEQKFWSSYKEYLKKNGNAGTVNDRYNYSLKYYKYLQNPNTIGELLTFSPNKRIHIMKALASLSKFCGYDDVWKQAIKRHSIKWSTGEGSLRVFDKIMNGINYGDMLKQIKQVILNLPKPLANIFVFNTVTGLRPIEVFKCINHIHNNLNEYWNEDKEILEHYKFPNEFIRRTKKVYISIANKPIIDLAKQCSVKQGYNAVKLMLKRKGIEMNMYYCRKVFATFLRNKGIEPEIIDLLQGRMPSSVFVNHYYRPDINEITSKRIRPLLEGLMKEFC